MFSVHLTTYAQMLSMPLLCCRAEALACCVFAPSLLRQMHHPVLPLDHHVDSKLTADA